MISGAHCGRLECPGCGSFSFSVEPDGRLVCDYCQTAYTLPGQVCPVCGAQNPSAAHQCIACGHNLGVLDAVFTRATGEPAYWLHQTRTEAAAVKAQEEAASQKRLAEMWAIERRRREELAQAQAERDRQARILWGIVVAFFFIVALVVIIVAVLTNAGPHPYLP